MFIVSRLQELGLRRGVFAVFLMLASIAPLPAAALETEASHAILVDVQTGAVLFEKNSDQPMAPSSMSKIMTVYMLFDALKNGSLSLDDTFAVSEKAWRWGGSKMYVMVNRRVRIEDLIRGIVVQSGNDASIVVAEGLASSEDAFAEEMNRRAAEIGLTGSSFKNATGWPADGHVMTARDLALLAQRTIADFPEFYHYYSETEFTYGGIKQGNRNPLLYKNLRVDGLKTGHTEDAGYGLTASAERDGRRLVLVLNGLTSVATRSSESARILEWGFREFENYALFKSGETVEQAGVWLGKEESVPLVIDRDVVISLPRRARREMRVAAIYEGPLPAPVAAGAEIAVLRITAPGVEAIEVPLRAGASVERLGLSGRLGTAFRHLLWGAPR